MSFSLVPMENVERTDRRAVVFLVGNPEEDFINAFGSQAGNSEEVEQLRKHLKVSATYYLGGHHANQRHHGWDKTEWNGDYTECHVFKPIDDRRYYGFKFHPRLNPRFEVFVIIHVTGKSKHDTDPAVLDRILRVARRPEFTAITMNYR